MVQVEQEEDVAEHAKGAQQTLLNIVEAFRKQEAYKKKMNLMYALMAPAVGVCTLFPTLVTTRTWCMIQATLVIRIHVHAPQVIVAQVVWCCVQCA